MTVSLQRRWCSPTLPWRKRHGHFYSAHRAHDRQHRGRQRENHCRLGVDPAGLGNWSPNCVIQFLKAETGQWGEVKAAQKLGIEWHTTGDGFTWLSKNIGETTARALRGWSLAQEKIASDEYDLVVLDEFTYLLHLGWLSSTEVVDWLKANKPGRLHLVITGREASMELMDYADLVTEMHSVKHPFEKGIKAQAGIDF